MTATIQKIQIKNFKAFPAFKIELNGRNLLMYGANGTGKSSLYWALYTFLESADKKPEVLEKYFNPDGKESLLHIHEQDPKNNPAEIQLSIMEGGTKKSYTISQDQHGTYKEPLFQKGRLASDFITYRFFSRFSNFRHSETIDFWPLFKQEIMPFSDKLSERWGLIEALQPHLQGLRGGAVLKAKKDFDHIQLGSFNSSISEVISSIARRTQDFYNEHFSNDDQSPLKIEMKVLSTLSYSYKDRLLTPPVIGIGISLGAKNIDRPQTHLNEAKLTQIAISIRLAASLVQLHDSPLKLLVVDDLLVSLDMSNRMRVIKILLDDEDFAPYQKIILTHDEGFFKEVRRQITTNQHDWMFMHLHRKDGGAPEPRELPDELARAEELLREGKFDEASLQLRKKAEETLRKFVIGYPDNGEYQSLSSLLHQAKNKLEQYALTQLEKILNDPSLDDAALKAIIPDGMSDFIGDENLSKEQKTQCCGRRTALRRLLNELLVDRRTAISVLKQIDNVKSRILNPAAHTGEPPLYEQEMEDALKLVRQLKAHLSVDVDST